ncbi:Alpha/Beta hydrolase protein [Apodospora peruviana]|uniref:Alpha/Beta hydrolase protein n=1 Tax=Apodospora peruviana TaxID=516989 RepID=A0AAE0HXG0_9PEZI|nr:Alpha/Beta hydrolase protein [Apodospora peruviana]
MTQQQQPPYPLHESVVDRIDAEYAAFYNKHIIDKQPVHLQPIEVSRSSGVLNPGAGPLQPCGSTDDWSITRVESEGPDVKVRCFTPIGEPPEAGWPVCVYIHGGGWVLGNIDTENVIATHLCARGKSVVVSVDYRLAPENPFPAAVDDVWEAVIWVRRQGTDLDLDITKMAIGGSSAGGNLAAVMCQRAADRGDQWFSLQLLSVPVMDNSADVRNNPSWEENQYTPGLPAAKMLWFKNHYLPNRDDWQHPEASPLFWGGDFSKLPPACMVVGELDVLKHEGEQFAQKLADAGVRCDVHVMRGQPHPFIAMDAALEAGARAITLFCEALDRAMYPSSSQ